MTLNALLIMTALPWVPLYRQAWEQLKSRLCLSG